jgi:hypothetical protein
MSSLFATGWPITWHSPKAPKSQKVLAMFAPMRWLREAPTLRLVLFLLLAFIGYLVVYRVVFPLLWAYRDHPVVWFLLAFLSGNHLPELFPEPRVML